MPCNVVISQYSVSLIPLTFTVNLLQPNRISPSSLQPASTNNFGVLAVDNHCINNASISTFSANYYLTYLYRCCRMHTDSQVFEMSVWNMSSIVNNKIVWIGSSNCPYACKHYICMYVCKLFTGKVTELFNSYLFEFLVVSCDVRPNGMKLCKNPVWWADFYS